MISKAPALRMAAGAALLLILLCPSVSAQSPLPVDPRASYFRFAVTCSQSFISVDFLGAGFAKCTAQDLTYDSAAIPGTTTSQSAVPHSIRWSIQPIGTDDEIKGWQALPPPPITLFGLGSVDFTVQVTNLAVIKSPIFRFSLLANYTTEDGSTQNATVSLVAQVRPYVQALVQTRPEDISQKGVQDQRLSYRVDITNLAVYPEYFHVTVNSNDPSFRVAQPGGVYVLPGEKKTVTYTVLTPKGTFYELGHSAQFTAVVSPSLNPGALPDAIALVRITGLYIPFYWVPMSLVALVGAVIVTRQARERSEIRHLEAGAPRRIQPTPRQAVLLAELKRTDPEAYATRKAQLDSVYAERRAEYRTVAKERRKQDREEMRIARAEFKAARRKQKREGKERRTLEARARKERKIAEAIEKTERKKREKVLAKARKRLEKQRTKLAKKEGKAAKKQAKIDAKQAKIDAKAAKKAEALAAKEAKAAAKAAKKEKKS